MMAHHIGLGRSLADRNDRDPQPVVDPDLSVERENHGVHGVPEHRVHHPVFESVPTEPREGIHQVGIVESVRKGLHVREEQCFEFMHHEIG